MSLKISPLASVPKYETSLPSDSKIKIEYRPFLVKEEKILLIAAESKNEAEMYRAMRDVVESSTFGKVDVETCPMIDIEYLFLKIRARSVGETATPGFKCPKCSVTTPLSIDINSLEPQRNPKHKKDIKIANDMVVQMRYPMFSDIQSIQNCKTDSEKIFKLIGICIDKIFTKEQTYNSKELTEEELSDFVDSLLPNQFKQLAEFFETSPSIEYKGPFKCPKCGHEETIELRGVQSFF